MEPSPRPATRSYRDLEVWQRSYTLALDIYRQTQSFPAQERFGLVSQLRRAAVSVPANIAEGNVRRHRQEYVQFLHIAQGSAAEMDTLLRVSKDLGYLKDVVYTSLGQELEVIGRMLTRLIAALAVPHRSRITRPQPGQQAEQ